MNETMERWLCEHPKATVRDAFKAGWFECTTAWCRGKREKMEKVIEMMNEIIS